jgi:hypothetical protein
LQAADAVKFAAGRPSPAIKDHDALFSAKGHIGKMSPIAAKHLAAAFLVQRAQSGLLGRLLGGQRGSEH